MTDTITDLEWLDNLKPRGIYEYKFKTPHSPTGDITLIGRFAGDENIELQDEIQKIQNSKEYINKYMNPDKPPSATERLELDYKDMELFVAHVFTDWKLKGTSGKTIPYSPDLALKVLRKLPNSRWKAITRVFANDANFVPKALSKKEVAEAGNVLGNT